jgi:two-component system response regulator
LRLDASSSADARPATASAPAPVGVDDSDRIVILVVDDDPGDCELIARAFEDCRAQVELRFAPDGEAALDYLVVGARARNEHPRLVLLDLDVPKIDGRATLRRIRQDDVLCALPVVVFTASESDVDILECYRCGANSYFTKPADIDGYRKVIRILESYWLRRAELPPDR